MERNPDNDSFESSQKKHTCRKALIGVLVTAGLAVVADFIFAHGSHVKGILTHKKIKAGKAAKELLQEVTYNKGRIGRLFRNVGCEEEIALKLAEIEKLPIDEQAKELAHLDKVYNSVQSMQTAKRNGMFHLRRGMTEYPEEVKNAIAEGRWLDAGELYEKYVQTLPNTFKAKTTGATVEETIVNVFGKDSKIKPHTYDLSQEGEYISGYKYTSGEGAIKIITSKDGILYEGWPSSGKAEKYFGTIPIKDDFHINQGIYDGYYEISLVGPQSRMGSDTLGKKYLMSISLTSRSSKMSPAQADLLSLAEHPEKFDASYIDKLLFSNIPDGHGDTNFDYDLAYSIIQSMTRGL